MAPQSSTLAWKISWTEEPGRLQSMGSLGVGYTERLHFHFSLSCIGEGNGNPLQCSCLENPRDGGACWAAIYGVAQSRTWLKRLSSSSSSGCKASLPVLDKVIKGSWLLFCERFMYSWEHHRWAASHVFTFSNNHAIDCHFKELELRCYGVFKSEITYKVSVWGRSLRWLCRRRFWMWQDQI